MALATSEIDTASAGAGTSITSASVTPTADALVVLWVSQADSDGTTELPTLSGTGWASGLTWTQEETLTRSALGGEGRLTCWTATVGGSPSAGTVTATASDSQDVWGLQLVEATDDGTPTVEQTATGEAANVSSFSVTLGSAPGGSNALLMGCFQARNGAGISSHTAGTGYTLYSDFSVSGAAVWQSAEYDLTAPSDGIADVTSNQSGNDWWGVALEIGANAGGGDVTLTADAGSVAITGTAADLLYGPAVDAESGTVAVTGVDASLVVGRAVDAESGSVVVTGTDATLIRDAVVGAEAGAIVVTGTAAGTLVGYRLDAEAGAVAVTGTDATLSVGSDIILTAEAGSVVVTGTDATLLRDLVVTATGGAVTVTGTDAGLLVGAVVSAEAGAVAVTGTDAGLQYGRLLTADAGSTTVTGTGAGTLVARLLTATGGVFAVTGTDATLTYGGAPNPLNIRPADQRTATPRSTSALAGARSTAVTSAARSLTTPAAARSVSATAAARITTATATT